jgi:hypothetical protein
MLTTSSTACWITILVNASERMLMAVEIRVFLAIDAFR